MNTHYLDQVEDLVIEALEDTKFADLLNDDYMFAHITNDLNDQVNAEIDDQEQTARFENGRRGVESFWREIKYYGLSHIFEQCDSATSLAETYLIEAGLLLKEETREAQRQLALVVAHEIVSGDEQLSAQLDIKVNIRTADVLVRMSDSRKATGRADQANAMLARAHKLMDEIPEESLQSSPYRRLHREYQNYKKVAALNFVDRDTVYAFVEAAIQKYDLDTDVSEKIIDKVTDEITPDIDRRMSSDARWAHTGITQWSLQERLEDHGVDTILKRHLVEAGLLEQAA